ncbi:contains similarity to collagens, partial [Plasmodium yoelii yoelii]
RTEESEDERFGDRSGSEGRGPRRRRQRTGAHRYHHGTPRDAATTPLRALVAPALMAKPATVMFNEVEIESEKQATRFRAGGARCRQGGGRQAGRRGGHGAGRGRSPTPPYPMTDESGDEAHLFPGPIRRAGACDRRRTAAGAGRGAAHSYPGQGGNAIGRSSRGVPVSKERFHSGDGARSGHRRHHRHHGGSGGGRSADRHGTRRWRGAGHRLGGSRHRLLAGRHDRAGRGEFPAQELSKRGRKRRTPADGGRAARAGGRDSSTADDSGIPLTEPAGCPAAWRTYEESDIGRACRAGGVRVAAGGLHRPGGTPFRRLLGGHLQGAGLYGAQSPGCSDQWRWRA